MKNKMIYLFIFLVIFSLPIMDKDIKVNKNDKTKMQTFLLNDINQKEFYYKDNYSFFTDTLGFRYISKAKYSNILDDVYTGSYHLIMSKIKPSSSFPPLGYNVIVTHNKDNTYSIKYPDNLIVLSKITKEQIEKLTNYLKTNTINKCYYINKSKTPWTYSKDKEMNFDLHAFDNFNNLDRVSLIINQPISCHNFMGGYMQGDGFFCEFPVTLSNNKYKLTIIINAEFRNNKYDSNINKYLYSAQYLKNSGINTNSYWFKLAQNEEIEIDMPEKYLPLSWGMPDRINSSTGSWGTHKQYVYSDSYVYTENGKISSWQD